MKMVAAPISTAIQKPITTCVPAFKIIHENSRNYILVLFQDVGRLEIQHIIHLRLAVKRYTYSQMK